MSEKKRIKNFKDLIVWKRSVDFVVKIYEVTKEFPKEELYGITSQIRRAAVSIPSNVAEGQSRGTDAVFANHIGIALGSSAELETQLLIALKLAYLDTPDYDSLVDDLTEIVRMLYGLRAKLKRSR